MLPDTRTVALVEFQNASDARRAFQSLAYKKFQNAPLFLEWAPKHIFKLDAPLLDKTTVSAQRTNPCNRWGDFLCNYDPLALACLQMAFLSRGAYNFSILLQSLLRSVCQLCWLCSFAVSYRTARISTLAQSSRHRNQCLLLTVGISNGVFSAGGPANSGLGGCR